MLEISNEIKALSEVVEPSLKGIFLEIDKQEELNTLKVLRAFNEFNISEAHFNSTTGYGYNDVGRDVIEQVFAKVLGAEDCLVRGQFISGTHALTVALFAYLRPGDTMLSITGKPYDTLEEVIGIRENGSSLASYNINYEQIDLVDNDFDYESIKKRLNNSSVKLIEIQRSKGYSTRKSITINQVEKVIGLIRELDKDVIIMVDNCYCEFVSDKEPTEVGADVMVGSLIKNLGGGIAPNGAYIAGRHDLVELAGERLTAPGEGREVGPTLGINKAFLQGLFLAPSVVASSLKTAVFASKMLEELGYEVEPRYLDKRADIVQNIIFKDSNKLIKYIQGIQYASPIDSFVKPIPSEMPGYTSKVIMAAGAFTQGSSIELSCDGPLREPFIAYQQGGLTYSIGKIGVMRAIDELNKIDI
ncbi:MAG: methionine gamma-lyase family protein [Bacilli bacterium]